MRKRGLVVGTKGSSSGKKVKMMTARDRERDRDLCFWN